MCAAVDHFILADGVQVQCSTCFLSSMLQLQSDTARRGGRAHDSESEGGAVVCRERGLVDLARELRFRGSCTHRSTGCQCACAIRNVTIHFIHVQALLSDKRTEVVALLLRGS